VEHRQDVWLEAAAAAQAGIDEDLRDEAYELFVAEASRCRLEDRGGRVRVQLRSGHVVEGELSRAAAVSAHLVLVTFADRELVLPVHAVLALAGSRPRLRVEPAPKPPRVTSITSWLRESWAAGDLLRVLDVRGTWRTGRLVLVGADHVELEEAGTRLVLPLTSVEAWER
jgi:hypothetical protein